MLIDLSPIYIFKTLNKSNLINSIKLFYRNGEKMDYSGGRTSDTIVSWVLKKSGPPSAQVTCAALKEKIAASKFVIAYFGAESEALYTNAHVAYANTEDKIVFVHTDDEACATEHGASTPGLMFFRKFETTNNAYTGAADKDSLVNFVKPLMVPTVFEFTEDEIEAIFGQQQPTTILFRSAETDKDAAFMTTFADAAKAHKGKMLFAYSDVSGGIQERLAEFMGVTKDQLPTLRAILPADMKKFESPNKPADLTVENIGKFLDDVLAGNIKPHLKSEAVPESNDGPVKVVVGSQFQDIVMDPTKDVFVKYYAPWCGHCKKLAPIWEELGEAYKDNANVVIAKFDATANEAEGVEVRGYPTLIFYPKDNKSGVNFDGDRTLEPLKKWLQENSPVLKAGGAAHDEL